MNRNAMLCFTKAKPAKSSSSGAAGKRGVLGRAAVDAGDHQNDAINSNRVVHMASVPTAMNSDCGVVGSCSSSDMTETL